MPLSIEEFGRLVAAKRGNRGIRAAAVEAAVSPATLSRVENGHMLDLKTFAALCKWIDRDPREFLGMKTNEGPEKHAAVMHLIPHLRVICSHSMEMLKILEAVNHTLIVHGKMDAGTPLHDRINDFLGVKIT
jgi:transcriptional regulator with XRE-family HTH domain